MMIVRVFENHSGFRGGTYYYVVDGNLLKPLSSYALTKNESNNFLEYEVDSEALKGKEIVMISPLFSCDIVVGDIDALARGSFIPGSSGVRAESYSYLNNLDFAFLTDEEKRYLRGEWREYFLPMIKELSIFFYEVYAKMTENSLSKNFLSQTSFSPLLQCQIKDSNASFPLSFLIPYSGKARQKSLEILTKEVYHAWLLIKIIETYKDKINNLNFKFNQSTPVFTISNKYSVWYDLDMRPTEICGGKFRRSEGIRDYVERVEKFLERRTGRLPLRADIIIMDDVLNCEDIAKKGIRVKLLIEARHTDFKYWEKDVNSQVIPFAELLRAENSVVVSMKPAKIEASVKIIDDVHPEGEGEREFIHFLREVIGD